MFVQIPLRISLKEEATFDTYVVEKESIALSIVTLQQTLLENKSNFITLYGEQNSGKTHLLQAACRFFSENKNRLSGSSSTVYLPLADKSLPFIPAILDGLEVVKLICIDDVEKILGNKEWEISLANLITKSQVLGQKILISSKLHINSWSIVTKELASAIVVVSAIGLGKLTKHDALIDVLKKRSEHAGFVFSLSIGNYLIKQYSNDLSELIAVLQIIEDASIVKKRKISLVFVKQILSEIKN